MSSRRMHSVCVPLLIVGVAAIVPTITACSSDSGDSAPPNLVGTWTGPYRYPSKGVAHNSTEDLVIERQDGELIFGYDQFVDKSGKTIKIDVEGSIDADGTSATLVETGGFFDIDVVDGSHIHVRFVKTDDKPTTFSAVLTRK